MLHVTPPYPVDGSVREGRPVHSGGLASSRGRRLSVWAARPPLRLRQAGSPWCIWHHHRGGGLLGGLFGSQLPFWKGDWHGCLPSPPSPPSSWQRGSNLPTGVLHHGGLPSSSFFFFSG